jgi:catechol 2,3-dioxygenase-like lactoylglutathione lyase family enzyme
MLDHVSITVSDFGRSAPFFDAVMAALSVPCVVRTKRQLGFGQRNRPGDDGHSYLSIVESSRSTVTADNRHWCFRAQHRAAVDAFHAAGIAAGGRCDGPPGLRGYHPGYYAAFLLDPDGNRIEAVCHHHPADD